MHCVDMHVVEGDLLRLADSKESARGRGLIGIMPHAMVQHTDTTCRKKGMLTDVLIVIGELGPAEICSVSGQS